MNGLVIVIIIMIILLTYLTVTNRNAQINYLKMTHENFQNQNQRVELQLNSPTYRSNYYPQLVDAKDVPQLYRIQNIYPYNDETPYDVADYPNVTLPGPVVGGGYRRQPTYGGSQTVIGNILPPLDISNDNIAPNNIHLITTNNTNNTNNNLTEVGTLYKIFDGPNNITLPLFVSKNENSRNIEYKYFTKLNGENKLRKVFGKNKFVKLGINDQVKVENTQYFYRVTAYQDDFPIY